MKTKFFIFLLSLTLLSAQGALAQNITDANGCIQGIERQSSNKRIYFTAGIQCKVASKIEISVFQSAISEAGSYPSSWIKLSREKAFDRQVLGIKGSAPCKIGANGYLKARFVYTTKSGQVFGKNIIIQYSCKR